MGVPLSVARGAAVPGSPWSRRDWALAQAFEMLDRARCNDCGHPRWISHNVAYKRLWNAHAERCFSCDATLRKQAEFEKDGQRVPAVKFWASLGSPR